MLGWVVAYPVTSAFLLVSFFCLLQSWWFKRDFFSPMTVYCFSQCITLAIAYLQLDKAMSDFKPLTWMVWILGFLSFCTGCGLAKLLAKSKHLPTRVAAAIPPKNYNWNLHVLFSFVPFFIFLLGVYGVITVAGNLLVFTDNPARWMDKSVNYGYYALFVSSGPLVVLLFGVASFSSFNKCVAARRVAKLMVLVTIVLNLMAYPNRTGLFFNLGFLLIFINFLYKKISPVAIMLVLVAAISAFIGISNLRNQYGGGTAEGKAMNVVVKLPYMYVANNYWNLDYAVNSPTDREIHPFTYGIDFFSGVLEYARISNSFKTSLGWDTPFNDRIQKVNGFNTVNYLWDVYKDFRLFGVFLLPFLCGLALSVLYLRMCKPFTPRQVTLYTYFVYFVGWWFFTSGYKQGVYVLWLPVVFFITTVCMGRCKLKADALVCDKVNNEDDAQKNIAAQCE